MLDIVEGPSIQDIKNWYEMLANLTTTAWSNNGICYFPYMPLTSSDYWLTEIRLQWLSGQVHSWVMVDKGRIIAHAALVKKTEFNYELGRWIADENAPRGAVSQLVKLALELARNNGWQVCVECTQAHTKSQFICENHGLRFAGVGILDCKVDTGITWDILYYDNLDIEPFTPTKGVLGNPRGEEIYCKEQHRQRLKEISEILSIERGGKLPPDKFHILPHRLETIKMIIDQNLN